jgi:predicted regulator of Ras-like GTPase activity (Roadblock/LC7/MglB family)
MKIPFLDFFKTTTQVVRQALQPSPPPPPINHGRGIRSAKPDGQRLSKTVLPNTTRSSTVGDPFKAASLATSMKISSGPIPAASQKRELPPAVALALQPKVERAISLELADILDQVPSGYVKSPENFDLSRRILLKASEIEKGMATGKPSVSLATIYEQVPEIFLHSLPSGETAHVPLPFLKVLEQFNKVQTRSDQEREQAVPQVETPILHVAIEDTERFGTTMEPTHTSTLPAVKVEPATAETLAIAEPEPVASETVASAAARQRGIPLSDPVAQTPKAPRPAEGDTAAPARIPFHLPPNGMGAPASEKVPASSGSPIPTGAPKGPTPARILFKMSPPSEDLRPKLTLVPGVEAPKSSVPAAAQPGVSKDDKVKIQLALQALMQNVPAFQLNGTPETIPPDVRVEFPMSLIEPQLATGRVAIEAKTFHAAMPEIYRDFFIVDAAETPVLLPLQEVLKNLPTAALKMREDQEETETGGAFETPFSIKAKEDAKRFGAGEPVPNPVKLATEKPLTETARYAPAETAAPEKKEEISAKATETPAKPVEAAVPILRKLAPAEPAAPQKGGSTSKDRAEASKEEAETLSEPAVDIKGRREKNEAKEVLARANALSGVAGCCLTFADGLSLTGALPAEAAADGLCAMAPSLLQRIERYMRDTKLGPLTAVTLHCAKAPVTFFMQGNICLTVLHAGGNLASETQNELAKMTKALSRTYSQPETSHVDH